MDPLEVEYRKQPNNKVNIRWYIELLYENHHILEAKYYHAKLLKEAPNETKTHQLGFLLSLKMVDSELPQHEKRLLDSGATDEVIFSLQLLYYYAYSDTKKMKECLGILLNIEPTERFTLEIVTESILDLGDYELAKNLVKYYFRFPKAEPNRLMQEELKRIMCRRFIDVLKGIEQQ